MQIDKISSKSYFCGAANIKFVIAVATTKIHKTNIYNCIGSARPSEFPGVIANKERKKKNIAR
jgi:hypothetical protein